MYSNIVYTETAWHVMVWNGMAGQGSAWQGMARNMAWHGVVWLGKMWLGWARLGNRASYKLGPIFFVKIPNISTFQGCRKILPPCNISNFSGISA